MGLNGRAEELGISTSSLRTNAPPPCVSCPVSTGPSAADDGDGVPDQGRGPSTPDKTDKADNVDKPDKVVKLPAVVVKTEDQPYVKMEDLGIDEAALREAVYRAAQDQPGLINYHIFHEGEDLSPPHIGK